MAKQDGFGNKILEDLLDDAKRLRSALENKPKTTSTSKSAKRRQEKSEEEIKSSEKKFLEGLVRLNNSPLHQKVVVPHGFDRTEVAAIRALHKAALAVKSDPENEDNKAKFDAAVQKFSTAFEVDQSQQKDVEEDLGTVEEDLGTVEEELSEDESLTRLVRKSKRLALMDARDYKESEDDLDLEEDDSDDEAEEGNGQNDD